MFQLCYIFVVKSIFSFFFTFFFPKGACKDILKYPYQNSISFTLKFSYVNPRIVIDMNEYVIQFCKDAYLFLNVYVKLIILGSDICQFYLMFILKCTMLPMYHVLSPKHVMIHAVKSALSFCLNSFSMLRVNKPYCLHCCISKYLNTDLLSCELSLAQYLRYLVSLQSRLTLCDCPLFVSGHEGRQDNVVLLEREHPRTSPEQHFFSVLPAWRPPERVVAYLSGNHGQCPRLCVLQVAGH